MDTEGVRASEIQYEQGKRRTLMNLLGWILRELGVEDPDAGGARSVLERTEAIAQLRAVCAEHGDNDWPDNLHLADVIDKHLLRHLGPGWTYCTDGLPEEGDEVLVAISWPRPYVTSALRGHKEWQAGSGGEALPDAYAWRPLPEPPPKRRREEGR